MLHKKIAHGEVTDLKGVEIDSVAGKNKRIHECNG